MLTDNHPNETTNTTRKLHIGGKIVSPGWEILNINEAPEVDHVCNANDLSRFESNTFDCIYASHIVEHLDYFDELQATLLEWQRTLRCGGKLYISVPDLDVISGLILDKQRLNTNERFFAMRMLFGGHIDSSDYHQVGLNEDFLHNYLTTTGYVDVTKVETFDLFDDTSAMKFKDVLISLNMTAVKPAQQYEKTQRNTPCPCNSGKKFKHCHGQQSY